MRLKWMVAAIALGAAAAVGACGGDSDTTGPGGAGGGNTGGTNEVGGGGAGGSASCTEITLGPVTVSQLQAAGVELDGSLKTKIGGAAADGSDILILSDMKTMAFASGTIDLGKGDEANYATCQECVTIGQDIDPDKGPAKTFFQQSGTLTIDASSDIPKGKIKGSLSDVTLIEVKINAKTFKSTPVKDGACLHVTSLDIDIQLAPDGWTCDPTFYNDGLGCDCNCGVVDPDCMDDKQEVLGCGGPGFQCTDAGICTGGTPPAGWTCDAAQYGDGKSCDCNCGAEDLDCVVLNPIMGCDAGQFCGSAGTCVDASGGDICADATPITAPGNYFGTLAGRTSHLDPGDSGCTAIAEPAGESIYAIALTAGQMLTVTGYQPDQDIALYLLSDCSMASSCVKGADDGQFGEADTLTFTATTAGTYYLVVDSFDDTNESPYALTVDIQ